MIINAREIEQTQVINESLFFKGLLAAASLTGVETIITAKDAHQVAFKGLVKELERKRVAQDPSTKRMPYFQPGPITGTFSELDNALISLQNTGITRPIGPYFNSVEVTSSSKFAEHILERFSEEERVLLLELSQSFIAKD